jgi:3-hydroxy-9,10-secoandrosta-1,3,5(10)-triene-9,17-dione monooxygenase
MSTESEALIERAKALAPMLRQNAAAADRERRISDATMAAIREAGFLRILQPHDDGGYALPPEVLWRVAVEIGRGCASTAWLVGLNGANVWLLSLFDKACRDEVFADGAQALVPVLTGGVGRDVEVREAAGGYRLSGRWRYASGIDHADWVAALVPLSDGPALMVVEAGRFGIDHDSWQVLGMRGTGSKDIALAETFVPRHRTLAWSGIEAGREHAHPLYRLPANPLLAMSVAAPLIGTARGIVDTLRETIARRVAAGSGAAQIDDPRAHATLGQCAAEIAMSETALLATAASLHDVGNVGLDERARLRACTVVAARAALALADRAVAAVGGSVLPQGSAMERGFRDIHAMASHFLLQLDPSAEAYGRLLLGLPPLPGSRL